MKQLSSEAFGRARQFLKTQARPLERALFECHFEGTSVDAVYTELAAYNNEDGGFGKGLEPDLRTPTSSALATGIALSILKEAGCPADHPLVRRAVAYLQATFDSDARVWRVIAPDANQFPHAPWWHDEIGSLARVFDSYRIIPRALILSSLHHYVGLVSAGWLDEVTEETVRYIEEINSSGEGGGSDLEYTSGLAQAENLPIHQAERLREQVRRAIPTAVVRDPARWSSYCITPLRAAPLPSSIGADLIAEDLQRHLDYQIEHQAPDGAWDPTWSWFGNYPEVWEQARQEWRGRLTLDALLSLQAFGRILP